MLLSAKASLGEDDELDTPLSDAIPKSGKLHPNTIAFMKMLIESGLNVNQPSWQDDETPLDRAIKSKNTQIVNSTSGLFC